ncbi:SDR family oxidoreductase [Caldicellulosiruptor acetigenus]|uniref:SDR family oxidoreductase n=1 Tax=Caldicellulosiruptor acetigenus TaxID=301953 RepID=UPI0009FE2D0C|nr:sugar nucleotide-binding protein [Caldicellulosiruptor acetigenus]
MSTPTTKVFSVTCNIFSFCVYFKVGTSFVVFCRKLYNLHSVFYQEVPPSCKSHFTSFSLIFVHYRNAPINKYGESKLLGEKFMTLTEYYYLIRVSWVFGIGNANFIRKVLDWSKERDILKIADDEISAPTYTDDLVYATYLLLKERAFGLYHITNTTASRFEWAEFVLRKIGWKGKLERAKKDDFKLPAKRPGYSVLDNFGLKETVNFEMPTWQDATERYLKQINLI